MGLIGGDKRDMHNIGDASVLRQENVTMARLAMGNERCRAGG